MTRAAFGFLALIGLLAFLALGSLLFGGCSSIPTGVRVVASSATATSLGNINWDTYTIPVFSVYTGPKTTIWVNRDYLALSRVSAGGCVTNDTSALGVYQTREQKQTRVELEFAPQGSALAAPAASQEPAPDAPPAAPASDAP